MWSLAVEVSFYAVLPVLAVLLLRRSAKGRPAVTLTRLAALAAVTPVWLIVVNTTDLLPNSAGMWLPGHLTCFTGGMALAVLSVVGTRWNACATLPLAAALYFAVATPIGGVIVGTVPAWVPVTKECLYAAIAMLVVGTVVLGSPNRYTRILSSPPVVWLGEISYEIFLLHTVVMAVVDESRAAVALVHRLTAGALCHNPRRDDSACSVTSPVHPDRPQAQASSRSAGTSAASARPRCDTASFSSGVNSAAVRVEPSGMNTGS